MNVPISAVLATRELEKLVEDVANRAKKKYKISMTKPRTKAEEFGFYLMNEKKTLLWFGVWMAFWKQEGFTLSLGVSDEDEKETPGILKAFCDAYNGNTKRLEDYTVGWIPQEIVAGVDPLEKVWTLLEPILNQVNAAARTAEQ